MIGEAQLLERFEAVRRLRDHGWLVRCRAHDDRTPSLHITRTDERWLLHCHAGCGLDDVLAAAGIDKRDLFAENGHSRQEIVATYPYTDEHGELLYQVCRFAPKDFRQRKPDGVAGWEWRLGDVQRVLYRLPAVVEAVARGEDIIVVEGEKDVHALEELGIVATTSPGGAGRWRPEYSEYLRGAKVTVIADKDEPGRAHARDVAHALEGIAAEVDVVEPARGKDISEHLAAGGHVAELVPLVDTPPDPVAIEEPEEAERREGRHLVLTDLSRVRPRPVRWLWQDRVPLGVLSLLAGKPKLGKSTLAYDLAAKASRGTVEGDLRGTPVSVLVVTFEDLVAETVVPRLIAAGADLARISTIEIEADGERDLVSLPDDIPQVAEVVEDQDVRLLVVDPLMAALAGGTDAHRDNQVRRVLAPLAKLAEAHDLAVLTVAHLNKGQGADLIGRVGGSVAFTGAARSLLVFGADPTDPDGEDGVGRVLAQRGNLARRAPSLAFRIEGAVVDAPGGPVETSKLVCVGETEARADELLAAVATSDERLDLDEAVDFLRAELADGARSARDVKSAARDAGISDATLRRAKAKLSVSSERVGGAGGEGHWEWSLRCSTPREHLSAEQVEHLSQNPLAERDSGPPGSLRCSTHGDEHLRPDQGSNEADRELERLERKGLA